MVRDPEAKVLDFFAEDPSSVGSLSYDAYIANSGSPPNRVTDLDVTAINGSMRARSRRAAWAPLIKRGDLIELRVLPVQLDLFQASDAEWARLAVPERLSTLFQSVMTKGIGITGATKLLHIKRPALIPVCDSYVLGFMGIPNIGAASGVALIDNLREMRGDLLPPLLELQQFLIERGYSRTLVRIVDALLWTGYADTWLSPRPRSNEQGSKR
jgi:hypothetical protein